jgi:hypothetical protein
VVFNISRGYLGPLEEPPLLLLLEEEDDDELLLLPLEYPLLEDELLGLLYVLVLGAEYPELELPLLYPEPLLLELGVYDLESEFPLEYVLAFLELLDGVPYEEERPE